MTDNELLGGEINPEDENSAKSKKEDHKSRILYLYRLLYEQTDENHGLTMSQIISALGGLGIKASRKAIYGDVRALEDFGVDVQLEEKGSASSYKVLSRKFELPELTALADYVISSHFFTAKKSSALIKKLGSLCSVHDAKQLDTHTISADSSAEYNENILYNIDAIHRAIAHKKQISFSYFQYSFDYKLARPQKENRGTHTCSPIALTWNDGKYYLIAYYPKYKGISHFRVDKMESAVILPDNAEKGSRDFKLSEYMKSTFSMFSGSLVDVTMRFENSLMNAVIDRFGKINPVHDGRGHFKFTVPVRVSAGKAPTAFFGWLFQFGTAAQIISPAYVRDEYFRMLEAVLNNKYNDEAIDN